MLKSERSCLDLKVKCVFDIMVVILLLCGVSVIFFFVMVVVRFVIGLLVFFKQMRFGYNGCLFILYKFRMMMDVCDENGVLFLDYLCLIRVGKLIRKLSIDEFFQFFNVIKGDISLVGFCFLLMDYLLFYMVEQVWWYEVKLGIMGWVQINGRNVIFWEEKFKFDVWYVDNCIFFFDLKILLLIVKKVFVLEGIY